MRKLIVFILLSISLFLASEKAFAEWEEMNPLVKGGTLTGRQLFGMAFAGKGRILLIGGIAGSSLLNDVWIYDINKRRWSKLAPEIINSGATSIRTRYVHGMAYMGKDRVLLYGGRYSYSSYYFLADTWMYHYPSNTLTNLNPAEINGSLAALGYHGMCYIEEGKVLLFGGRDSSTRFNDTWLYNAGSNEWRFINPTINGSSLTARERMGLAYIGNGKAVMFGGYDGSNFFNDTWIYDLNQNQWTEMLPNMVDGTLTPRYYPSMAYIGDDRVLLFGGYSISSVYNNDIWMYDLSDNQWTNLTYSLSGILPLKRSGNGLAYASLGQVVMFGGYVYNSGDRNDTWCFSLLDDAKDNITWQIQPGGVELTWSLPDNFTDAQFAIFRNGQQISSGILPGTPSGGNLPFTYLDPNPDAGKLYRYQLKEINSVMDSEIDYPEFAVPYCP